MPPKVAILAGSGALPEKLIEACLLTGRQYFVVAFKGATNATNLEPDVWVDMAAVGQTLELIHEAGCKDVVLAGSIQRPPLTSLRPDRRGARLLAKILQAGGGDNALLSTIVSEIEAEGLRVIGSDKLLSSLTVETGVLGKYAPDDQAEKDIKLGSSVLRALGDLDVSQSVIVQHGRVLGIEGAEGTDALVARCSKLRTEGSGGVLVKRPKLGQERRVDLPAIGLTTVENVCDSSLAGIAIEAHGVLILEKDRVVEFADRWKLFLVAISAELSL